MSELLKQNRRNKHNVFGAGVCVCISHSVAILQERWGIENSCRIYTSGHKTPLGGASLLVNTSMCSECNTPAFQEEGECKLCIQSPPMLLFTWLFLICILHNKTVIIRYEGKKIARSSLPCLCEIYQPQRDMSTGLQSHPSQAWGQSLKGILFQTSCLGTLSSCSWNLWYREQRLANVIG